MRTPKLEQAITEAKRFIRLAELAIEEIKEYHKSDYGKHDKYDPRPSRKFAAAKRASLDLSAVLVELRKC
ncbi:MAG: hypothetical protein UX75_C0036G0004 [Candidatus Moranbacteria bacterium GW2011_GWE2_47_10]|nr:MAG: hypothetical protein UX75_C0036G0004 [Candidatus Moranbacteria bacterium GW2011_GWE2_47_10]